MWEPRVYFYLAKRAIGVWSYMLSSICHPSLFSSRSHSFLLLSQGMEAAVGLWERFPCFQQKLIPHPSIYPCSPFSINPVICIFILWTFLAAMRYGKYVCMDIYVYMYVYVRIYMHVSVFGSRCKVLAHTAIWLWIGDETRVVPL